MQNYQGTQQNFLNYDPRLIPMQQPGYPMQHGIQMHGLPTHQGNQLPGMPVQPGMSIPAFPMQQGMHVPGMHMPQGVSNPGYHQGMQMPGMSGISMHGFPMQQGIHMAIPGQPRAPFITQTSSTQLSMHQQFPPHLVPQYQARTLAGKTLLILGLY